MTWQGRYDTFFIGGKWVAPHSSQTVDVISPFTEQAIAKVPRASKADIDAAVAAARSAFDSGPWPRLSPDERIETVLRLKTAFERRREELSQIITDEMGSPISLSRAQQSIVPILMLEAQTTIARTFPWKELRQGPTGNSLVVRQPKGVVAMIVPWNVPMMTTIQKLGPALIAGCTVVLKPALESPLSAYMLGEMLIEAGLPEGVVNIVPADREESQHLALHPGVDKVSFTGSTVAGRTLAAKCGELLRPITLELGGKSAGIFLDDADIPAAVEFLRMGSFRNSGQICSLKTRILVSKKREGEVVEALAHLIDSMPIGDPNETDTQIGPMVSQRQQQRVEGYIDIGIKEGGRPVRGGAGRPKGLNHGWFVRPTLLAGVDPGSRIAQEEVFGPVLAVSTYENEEEAIAIANNSDYGLSGSVFSADPERGVMVAERIRTGVVEVNGGGIGFHSPFGGVKLSGIGREGGREGFEPYVEIKSIGLPKAYADSLAS